MVRITLFMPNTKIVATLGPASGTPELLDRLIAAGVDVFRLNLSHGTREEHAERVGASILTLPLFPAMTDADVDRVCAAVRAILRAHAR